jgi:sugar phosphate isomerase/epimerase
MELSLSTLMWRGQPLAEVLEAARATDVANLELYAGVDAPQVDVLGGYQAWTEVREQLGDLRVTAVAAPHPSLPCSDSEGGLEAVEYTVAAMKAAKFLGARVVVVSMGDTGIDAWDQAWERGIAALRMIVKQGQRSGVRLAVELNQEDVLNSLRKVRRLLEEIPDPRLGIALNTGLAYAMRVDWPEALLTVGHRLYHVRLQDATRRMAQLAIGHGEVSFTGVFKQLRAHGYAGAVSVALEQTEERHGLTVDAALAEGLPRLWEALEASTPARPSPKPVLVVTEASGEEEVSGEEEALGEGE